MKEKATIQKCFCYLFEDIFSQWIYIIEIGIMICSGDWTTVYYYYYVVGISQYHTEKPLKQSYYTQDQQRYGRFEREFQEKKLSVLLEEWI